MSYRWHTCVMLHTLIFHIHNYTYNKITIFHTSFPVIFTILLLLLVLLLPPIGHMLNFFQFLTITYKLSEVFILLLAAVVRILLKQFCKMGEKIADVSELSIKC